MEKFYKEIIDWLLPKGYTEIYKDDEGFHFSKDAIRVICVKHSNPYCYLYSDIVKLPHCLGLRTCNFEIGIDKLEELHEYMKVNEKLLIEKY